jgi:hypothetical protein
MPSNEYHFTTVWRVEGTCSEVAHVLSDAESLARWWPSVYLQVERLRDGDTHGIGRRVRLRTRGWLPYTLEWQFEIVESRFPYGFTLVAKGDFDGVGVWSLEQHGAFVHCTYDWRVRAEKPLLRYLSPVLKPVFSANHRWAMARGEESLALELARRRARSDAERAAIPAPPGPFEYSSVVLVGSAMSLAAAVSVLASRLWRAKDR